MSAIITLYGNIATGKSTISKALAERFDNLVVLNDDAISSMLGAGNYAKGWRALGEYQIEAWFATLVPQLLNRGRDVLIDLPAHTNARRRIFEQATSCSNGTCGLGGVGYYSITTGWNPDPAVHGTTRFLKDARGYSEATWIEVATRLNSERETPEVPWTRVNLGQIHKMITSVPLMENTTFSTAFIRGLQLGLLPPS